MVWLANLGLRIALWIARLGHIALYGRAGAAHVTFSEPGKKKTEHDITKTHDGLRMLRLAARASPY